VRTTARRLVRRARERVAVLRRGPRRRLAGRLAAAGLVDRLWYADQCGLRFRDDRAAATHYLATGRAAGHSPHPLIEPEWIAGARWRSSPRDPVELYLAGEAQRGGPHPLFDDAVWLATAPTAAGHPGGPLGHFLATAAPEAALPCPWTATPLPRAATLAAMHGGRATPAAVAAEADWTALAAALTDRDPALVSVVVAAAGGWAGAWSLVDGALSSARGVADPVEVVVVLDPASRPAMARILGARAVGDPRAEVLRVTGRVGGPAAAWNAGLVRARGARVVLANAVCAARPSGSPPGTPWWLPLAAALDDARVAAAGPLVLGPGATLVHAGLGRHRHGEPPYPMFADAAPEDAAAGDPLVVAALGDEALAVRAADLVRVGGADAGYAAAGWGADLSARVVVADDHHRDLRTVGEVALFRSTPAPAPTAADLARLLERTDDALGAEPDWDEQRAWRRAGLGLGAPGTARPRAVRRPEPVGSGPAAGRPALRWCIGTAAPFSEHGDRWGDVHFAAALAAALRRLGQHVVVERRGTTGRATTHVDDVFLSLRGLDDMPVRARQVNLLWVISHPDLVTPEEVRRYDASFAAGARWAASMTERAGVPVSTLLQATDPERFHPGLAEPDTGAAVLFVGSSRGVERAIVRDAVAAGLDLSVYGTRWEGLLDPRYLRAGYLPNDQLGAAYRAAGVLLNDHWPDMAEQGFYSNRLFDAVAAGARVVSDPVPGIPELFGGAVQEYRTREDLVRLAGPDGRSAFPDQAALLAISERVRHEHSFDARAAALLDAALAVVTQRADSTPAAR
jgi:hypothetical protein